MASRPVVLEIPERILLAEKTDEASFGRELSVLAAVKLFELGRLSSGRAAELAASGMWIPQEFPRRILVLAGEDHGG